ncbi:MAG: alpha/beta hydrolase [Pseudomonadota bacterium]
MKHRMVETSHSDVAIAESVGDGPPVLFIHGNSSCKEVFRNQLQGDIGQTWCCIAMDLPGHGRSADAADPETTYNMPGYADTALEMMSALGHDTFALFGWSLGGHIGIEMLHRSDRLTALMISGSPPIGKEPDALSVGFKPSEHMHLAGQSEFTDEEVDAYARATCGINAPFEDFLRDAVARTDGRARELMLSKFIAGVGCNQKHTVMNSDIPFSIVNGAEEPFVNNDFVASIGLQNLWDDKLHLLEDVGHAPFWEAPELFDPLLMRFLKEHVGHGSSV